jgi:hypothetical protein
VHWGTDDWPPFAHYAEIDYMMPVKAPSEGLKAFWEEFDAQYEAGGFWIGIWHPFLTGRLARWRLVEQWLEQTLKTRSVWFAPLEDIIGHVKKVTAEATARAWSSFPITRQARSAEGKARAHSNSHRHASFQLLPSFRRKPESSCLYRGSKEPQALDLNTS